jgi:hypothetical protein
VDKMAENIGDYDRILDINVMACEYCGNQASHYDEDGNPICIDCLRESMKEECQEKPVINPSNPPKFFS